MGIYRAPEKTEWENYDVRPVDTKIDTIILHYTVSDYHKAYLQLTAERIDPRPVSAHYLVREDGRIDNLVADKMKARHAGISSWNGKENINDNSIGIEIVNPGSGEQGCYPTFNEWKLPPWECIKHDFPRAQLDAVITLIDYLKSVHQDIKNYNIIGHSDITAYQARKMDPGVMFDWQYLKNHGHGIYSNLTIDNPVELFKHGTSGESIRTIQKNLHTLGYNITQNNLFDLNMANVVRAFNIHHNVDTKCQNKFDWDSWDSVGNLRLHDLLVQHSDTYHSPLHSDL